MKLNKQYKGLPLNLTDIKNLYFNEKKSIRYISKKYKTSVATISLFFKKNLLPIRQKSKSMLALYESNNIEKFWQEKDGYIVQYILPKNRWLSLGKNKMKQHRYVYSKHLNRPLANHENVHHKNGVRHDNRLENLELWSKVQPSGQRVIDKLKYAQEIIKLYDKDVKMGRIK